MAIGGLARYFGRHAARLVMVSALGAGMAAVAAEPTASAAPGGPGPGTARVFAGGVGGPARGKTISLTSPCGVAFAGGHLYFTDSSGEFSPEGPSHKEITDVVRSVNPRTGLLTTVAGVGLSGTYGDRGPAWRAELSRPCAVTFDHHGNMIIADAPQVRVIAARSGTFYGQRMRAGRIYTIATLNALLRGVAVDYAGNVVLTTTHGTRTRAYILVRASQSGSFYGRAMQAGHIYRVWRGPAEAANTNIGPITVDGAGNPLVASDTIFVLAARSGTFDGRRMRAGHTYTLSTLASAVDIKGPGPAVLDRHGNVIMASVSTSRLAVLARHSGRFFGRNMRAGHVYHLSKAYGFAGDGGPVGDAKFRNVQGLAVDGSGNLVIADTGNHRVRVVAVRAGTFYGISMRANHVYTVAGNASINSDSGDGGLATRAQLWQYVFHSGANFAGLAANQAGDVFLSDTFNNRIRMVPAHSGSFFGQRMRGGDIYTIAGSGGNGGYSGDGGPARKAQIRYPGGLTLDGHGNALFADAGNGVVRVVAARAGTFYGIAMRAAHIYTIAGGGSQTTSGGPATALALDPVGLAVDGHGNVLITNGIFGGVAGVWAVAAKSGTFYGQPMTAGDIYQIAGGGLASGDWIPAISAGLPNTVGVAVDGAGNVLIADEYQNPQHTFRVRVVAVANGTFYGQPMTAGDIYTIAGGGTEHGSGHLATQTRMQAPRGISLDGSGNVLITVGHSHVQVIAVRSGTFYGRRMTALHLYTIAGGGGAGIVPDNMLATKIALLRPQGIAVDPAGDVLINAASEARVILVRG